MFRSRADAVGAPSRVRVVQTTVPPTAVGEGAFFLSDGTGGLTLGEPYFVPPGSGVPVDLYQKPYVEDLAETLLFGNTTGDDQLIVLTNGDAVRSEDSAASVPGRNVILTPGSIVDSNRGSLVWGLNQASALRGIAGVDLQYGRTTPTHRIKPGNDYAAIVGGKGNGFGYFSFAGPFSSTSTTMFAGAYNDFSNGTDANSVILGGKYLASGGSYNPLTSQNNVMMGYATYALAYPAPSSMSECFVSGTYSSMILDSYLRSTAVFGQANQISSDHSYGIITGSNQSLGDPSVYYSHGNSVFGRGHSVLSSGGSCSLFGRFCDLTLYAAASQVGGNTCTNSSSYALVHGGNLDIGYLSDHSAMFGDSVGVAEHPNAIILANSSAFSGVFARSATTVGTTPDHMTVRPDASSTYVLDMTVVARQTGGTAGTVGDSAMWTVRVCIRRNSAGAAAIIGVPTGTGTPSAFADAGAGAWTVTLSVGATFPVPTPADPASYFVITVTGELDKDISWAARVDYSAVT